MTITIKDGESLWEISQKYEEQHGLSKEEFFKWVEKHNGVSRDYIVAGKDLVLPIKSEPIAIDEVQFFEENIVDVVEHLADKGIRVIVAGLDKDFRGEPFGTMPTLLTKAEFVTKLYCIE